MSLLTLEDTEAASRVVIAPERGAIVKSFTVGARELLYMDEATFADPTKNVRGGIPVLFPSPGKLEGDRFERHGRGGSMKQHGFARTLPWTVMARELRRTTLALQANAETRAQYPWDFRAELVFSLDGACLRITFRLENRDTTDLPFALGYHPYFLVTEKRGVQIDTRATRAYDNVQKAERRFTGFDLTAPELDLHLLDHGSSATALRLADGTHIALRASNEFGLWVVWTLAGRDFVCVEPWTAPGDALNSGARLRTVPPGATSETWFEIATV